MKVSKALSRKQFAALVVKQLERNGISCVLVGGACVSIYTDEKHHSKDLDFISPSSHESIAEVLAEIGFERKGRYKMLSPTQCVMDRLAAWFHWSDRRSLIHAIWIFQRHPVNLTKVKNWAKNEGALEKYEEFLDQLKKINNKK